MLSLSKTFSLLGQILSIKDQEHRVGDGDSLVWLAEKYGTTVTALKKLNNMKDDVIYSGRFVTHHSDICAVQSLFRGNHSFSKSKILCFGGSLCRFSAVI